MKQTSINFNAKIKPIKPLNDEFVLCKCYVQGCGKNRNYSYMSKDNVLKNIGTLSYIPVVGHLMKDDETGQYYFGSHDYELTCDENGIKFETLTVPFGVVCENQYDFETINEYGVDVEYLVSNIILWTGRYPELKEAIYNNEVWFSQSMEINPIQYRPLSEDSNYTEILEWTYSALCILGKSDNSAYNTEPCFINAKIEPYNFSSNDFSKLMAEMKHEIAMVFENINITQEGGLPLTDETNIKDETFEEDANKKIETGTTVNEEISDDITPTEDFDNTDENSTNSDVKNDETGTNGEFDITTFSSTYGQKRDALNNALGETVTQDENGEFIERISYWINDFDDEYVYVEKETYSHDNWNYEKGRFKYSYDEVNLTAVINSDFEKMIVTWLTLEENELIQSERNKFETMSVELNELRTFKQTVTDEKRKSDIENMFARFDKKLSGFADFETLKASEITMNIEELEEKLFAMIGKKTANFSVHSKETVVTVPVETYETTDDDGYGGILARKYNN